MPSYHYQVRSAAGELQVGTLASDNVATAAAVLRNQGFRVLNVSPVATSAANSGGLLQKLGELNSGRPKQRHVLDFTPRSMALPIRQITPASRRSFWA